VKLYLISLVFIQLILTASSCSQGNEAKPDLTKNKPPDLEKIKHFVDLDCKEFLEEESEVSINQDSLIVKVRVSYEQTHGNWELVLGNWLLSKITDHFLKVEHGIKFFALKIHYKGANGIFNSTIYTPETGNEIIGQFKINPLYASWLFYLSHHLTPFDFQVYDNALIKNLSINTNSDLIENKKGAFYTFLLNISFPKEEIEHEEGKAILLEVIGIAKEYDRPKALEHFEYFFNTLSKHGFKTYYKASISIRK
jgi:hypothetical protein